MSDSIIEKGGSTGHLENGEGSPPSSERAVPKVDKHGISLQPQPSDHPDDPLNWPQYQKVYIACLVSALVFTAQLGSALINPAFLLMSKDLGITIEEASYCTTVFILFGGVFSLFVVPFVNMYGRRPLYLIFTLIAAVGQFVSAGAPRYGGIVTGRVLNGIGASVPLGIGAASICDLFTQGERGLFIGLWTVATTNGPHIAPLAGGYIAQNLGWRWCFWIPGIVQAALWIILIFSLPETLFSRADHINTEKRSFVQKLFFHGRVVSRRIRLKDFLASLRMARYPAVLLPALWFMTANTYGSALFAVTGSHIATKVYGFNIEQTGLFMGVPLTVGCTIGEASAGWVSDMFVNAYTRRYNGYRKPEARLYLLPLCTLLAIGTATYGYCIETQRPWITAAVCMAVSGMGTQIGTTMVYTYATDSYKPQSGEIGAVVNLFKSVFAFNIGFYALPFGESSGFDVSFSALAAINLALLGPIAILMVFGERIREWQGRPTNRSI